VRVHPLGGGPLAQVPMGGDADTIQAAGWGWRAGSPFTVVNLSVYRQVVDLASVETASYVIPGGASGDPDSPYFGDQLAEWADHRRIPMGPPGPEQDHGSKLALSAAHDPRSWKPPVALARGR
jgi:acyl-homoserine lactone acylase PvdQ